MVNICKNKASGITLVALIITIIILLILAGITISTLTNTGLFTRAQEAKENSLKSQAEEEIKIVINEWVIERATGTIDIEEFLKEKQSQNEIDSYEQGDEKGTYKIIRKGYEIIIDSNGNIVEEIHKIGVYPQIKNIKIVANQDGTGDNIESETQYLGTTLYINFEHSIEGGTTTVDKTLPYPVTENGKVEFTITGTVGNNIYTKKIYVNVTQYTNEEPHIEISDIKVVSNSNGTGTNLKEGSQGIDTKLYINFTHNIRNGTTSVDKTLPYEVTDNGDYEFTVTGKIGDKIYEEKINVTVNQYSKELKLGSYVKYNVKYTDSYTGNQFTEKNGWRVLDLGTENADGTRNGVKLISTGIPAQLYYHNKNISSAVWKGSATQAANYRTKFYGSSSDKNPNMLYASGLYYNFRSIVFSKGTSTSTTNTGFYTEVKGQTSGNLSSTAFIADGATEVHNLTLDELNDARNKKAGRVLYALKNDADGSSSQTKISTSNDAAKGLFYLRDLNKYGYTSSKSNFYYWLASPRSAGSLYVWSLYHDGVITYHSYYTCGVRPVVSLPNNYKLEVFGN